MFGVELSATFHLYFIACGPAIFYVATDICVGVDMVTKVVRGLIDLLVAVVAPTSMGVWWVGIVA